MSHINGLVREASPDPFEPVRDAHRFEIPPAALEQLASLAKVQAHYRPTFANSLRELFAKARRWHRLANRSIEMDAAAKQLNRIAKEARKLKDNIDKLSSQARVTLGLYVMRLEQFGETGSHEAVRDQIEDLLQAGSAGQAVQKVEHLSWAVGRIQSAAATETWPKRQQASPAPWKRGASRTGPHIDMFDRFMVELSGAVRACNGALRIDQDTINDDLTAFLRAASPYLPGGFVPWDALDPAAKADRSPRSRLKRLTSLWSSSRF
jgi:hypothetical protein